MNPLPGSYPILRCDEARTLETKVLGSDEAREWAALQRAGRAIAAAILQDGGEIGGLPEDGRLLVLAGKGHNGGDALIAAQALLARLPAAKADVLFVFGLAELRPLADRAWRQLASAWPGRGPLVLGGRCAGTRAGGAPRAPSLLGAVVWVCRRSEPPCFSVMA